MYFLRLWCGKTRIQLLSYTIIYPCIFFTLVWTFQTKGQQFPCFWSLQKQVDATASINSIPLHCSVRRTGTYPSIWSPVSRFKKKKRINMKTNKANLYFSRKNGRGPFRQKCVHAFALFKNWNVFLFWEFEFNALLFRSV